MKLRQAMGDIRSLLNTQPSFDSWFKLINLLNAMDPDEQRDGVLPYVSDHLKDRWPDVYRPVPKTLTSVSARNAPWLRLCRSITATNARTLELFLDLLSDTAATITHIKVSKNPSQANAPELLFKLLNTPQCANIDALVLPKNYLNEEEYINKLLQTSSCHTLKELKMPAQNLQLGIPVEDVLQHPMFDTLEYLDIGDAMNIDELLDSGRCPPLKSLSLGNKNLSTAQLAKMANARELSNLEYLSLYNGFQGNEGLQAILASPHMTNLKYLNVGGCNLTSEAFHMLAGATTLQNLELLWIWSAPMTPGGLQALLNSPNLPNISRLNLNNNAMTVRHMNAIAQSKQWPKMKCLYLNSAQVGDTHMFKLFEDNIPLELTDFECVGNTCTHNTTTLLAKHTGLQNLYRLNISIKAGKKDILEMHSNEHLSALTKVTLHTKVDIQHWLDSEKLWPESSSNSETFEARREEHFTRLTQSYDLYFEDFIQ